MMSMLSGSIEISNNPQTQVPVKRRISRDEFFQKLREEHDAERRYRLTSIMLPLDGIKRPASVEEWFTSIGRFGNGLDVIPTPTVIIPGNENICPLMIGLRILKNLLYNLSIGDYERVETLKART